MEFKGWNGFEDFAKACGYTNTNNTQNENNNMGCSDIPNGFQNINPELFIIIGEILGNIIAGSIPSNLQNSLGNWFELIGQAILTYNAQQQYYQQGPGRYFDPQNYNINNPFCRNAPNTSSQNTNTNNNSKNPGQNNDAKIAALESRIKELADEIDKLRNIMENK